MGISRGKLVSMYRNMFTLRKLSEKMYDHYSKSADVGNFLLRKGEEAIPVAICASVRCDDSFKLNFSQTPTLFPKEGYE